MGISIERIAEKDRFETAILIADEVKAITESEEAFLVNEMDFSVSLSVSSVVARDGIPILLTKSDTLNKDTSNTIKEWMMKVPTLISLFACFKLVPLTK